jgi:hypothetical protein
MLTPYAEESIEIINVDFETTGQLTITYSAFIKYLKKMGIQRSGTSTLYILQESL